MFFKTRLQLTAWYLLIIMTISIAFSVFIYVGASHEFDRILRVQKFRIDHPQMRIEIHGGNAIFQQIPKPEAPDPQVIGEARQRVLLILFGVNGIIFLLSSGAGYFLAGRTLGPIQEMMDEQNRFITDASHELNTPLTALKTSIEVNLRNSKLSVIKARGVLQSNLEDVNNLQALSEELILLTQYQKPYKALSFDTISLNECIESAIDTIHILAQEKNIIIQKNSAKLQVFGNKKMLIELFVILLDNAIKYSKNKGQISITAKKEDSHSVVTVKDTGIGISKENLPYIFNRFYRADKSRTKQTVDGYGLGLSIAKRIVTLHKGDITIQSTKGIGTTCHIQLPTNNS